MGLSTLDEVYLNSVPLLDSKEVETADYKTLVFQACGYFCVNFLLEML